jgi:hypothetical protein
MAIRTGKAKASVPMLITYPQGITDALDGRNW